jgi:hypothetical protein
MFSGAFRATMVKMKAGKLAERLRVPRIIAKRT